MRNEAAVADIARMAWSYLHRHHRGRARAVPQARLARALGCNDRALQRAIQWMLEREERLVVSSCATPKGVYVPETRAEKAAYLEQLRRRLVGLARRMKHVKRAPIYPPPARQRTLFGVGARHASPFPEPRVGDACVAPTPRTPSPRDIGEPCHAV